MSESTRQRTGLLGLARLLALAVAGLAALIYLLGFSGEVTPLVTSQSGLLLIGGGLLAGFAALPRAPRLLLPAVALVVLGVLDLLLLVSTDLVQLSGVAIVATVLAVLELGVAIVALLVDQGVLRAESLFGGRLGQPPSSTGAAGPAATDTTLGASVAQPRMAAADHPGSGAGGTPGVAARGTAPQPSTEPAPTPRDAQSEPLVPGYPPGYPTGGYAAQGWGPPTGWGPPGWGPQPWAPAWGPPMWTYPGAPAAGQASPAQWFPGHVVPGQDVPGRPPVPGHPTSGERDPERPPPRRAKPGRPPAERLDNQCDAGERPAVARDDTGSDEPGRPEPTEPDPPSVAGTDASPDLIPRTSATAATPATSERDDTGHAHRPGEAQPETEWSGRPG